MRQVLPDNLRPLIRDLDWDEDQRLADWLAIVDRLRGENMPAALAAAIAWDAWQTIEPLQHQHWLGNLLVAALLRQTGKVGSHLFCLNAGLRIISRDRRRARDRTTRLLAVLHAFAEAAATGLKEIDRLALAKSQMERRLRNRRKNSSLPALIELVLARPLVSAGLVAAELKISQRAALGLVAELGIREVTGRGRYRAWGPLAAAGFGESDSTDDFCCTLILPHLRVDRKPAAEGHSTLCSRDFRKTNEERL
ncbi:MULTISPECIES: RHE_PE00001 family protein [unclassified Mesorhizobium]|uniref:RHE_PE00001 family protein n=2 Tax=Mesorhizobium TaxID=68287 RepID=UPI0032AF76CE